MSELVPQGWEEKTLETLVAVDSESLKGNTDPNYRFKYIDISCVSTGSVAAPAEQIMFKDAPSRAKRIVKCNDVLVATVRPNLKAFAHFDEEGDGWVASTGFAVLRHMENSDSRFIYNVMLSDDVSKQIDRLVAGSNYPAINSSDIKNLTLLSPPLPEQKKIASILTSVDEVIETTQRQIDKLQDLKKATMNELLTKGIGHTEFKDSALGRIPKSWEAKKLGDFAEVTKLAGFEYTSHFDYSVGGEIIAIRALNLTNGRLDLTNVHTIPRTVSNNLPRSKLFTGDILITYVGVNIGELGYVDENDRYHLAPNVGKISFNKKMIDTKRPQHNLRIPIVGNIC